MPEAPSSVRRVVLCPGQGAQFVGMARAWLEGSPEARAVMARADEVLAASPDWTLARPLSAIMAEGPAEELNRTDVSQPAIFAASIACWRGLLAHEGMAESDVRLAATAGLSLGEYTALCVAGAIGFEDALRLVALRGRAMQDAAEAAPSGMVALIGADEASAQSVCDETLSRVRGSEPASVLVCANFNAPGQVVISGSRSACEASLGVAQEKGLRAQALPVAGAFHSPLMAPAADRLRTMLAKTTIHAPRCPVLSNVTGSPHEAGSGAADSIRARLVEQLTSPVRWSQDCQWILSHIAPEGRELVELAPGKTLSGLMRRIDREAKVTNHDEP
ncbi:MAG: ACP S-malonyltransferase [Phycisphaerales bacterium]|nr:ACP S-malonyltransferase [Phycisphaerales bacterium]